MNRAATAGKYILIATLAGVGVFALLLFNADLGRFAPRAGTYLSTLLGRELSFDGSTRAFLDLDGTLRVEATDVRLASTAWSTSPQLLSVGAGLLELRLWSFFGDGPVIIEMLELTDTTLSLERTEGGYSNWDLSQPEATDPDTERFTLPILPNAIRIRDSLLTLDAPALSGQLRLGLDRLEQEAADDRSVSIDVAGFVNEEKLSLHADSPDIDHLVQLRDIEVSVEGRLGEVELDGDFLVDDVLFPRHPRADFRLTGPSAEYLLELLNLQWRTRGPLDLKIDLKPQNGRQEILVSGHFGAFDLNADGWASTWRDPDAMQLDYRFSGPDAGNLMALFDIEHGPRVGFALAGNSTRTPDGRASERFALELGGAKLTGELLFARFPDPSSLTARVDLDAPDTTTLLQLLPGAGDLPGPLSGSLTVDPGADGATAALQFSLDNEAFNLRGTGSISRGPGNLGSSGEILLDAPDIATLAAVAGVDLDVDAPLAARLNLQRSSTGYHILPSDAVVGDHELRISGSVGDQPLHAGTRLEMTLAGPDLDLAAAAIGLEQKFPVQEPYRLETTLTTEQGNIVLHRLHTTVGNQRARASGRIAPDPLAPATRVAFEVTVPSLEEALRSKGVGASGLPTGTLTASGILQGTGDAIATQAVEVELGGITAALDGQLLATDLFEGSRVSLQVKGDNLRELVNVPGPASRLALPFELHGNAGVESGELRRTCSMIWKSMVR